MKAYFSVKAGQASSTTVSYTKPSGEVTAQAYVRTPDTSAYVATNKISVTVNTSNVVIAVSSANATAENWPRDFKVDVTSAFGVTTITGRIYFEAVGSGGGGSQSIPASSITSGVLANERIPDLSNLYSRNDPKTLNVKSYGAVGNNTNDDTAAIQAALNDCAPGGVVVLPVGQYRTTAPLRIPPYVTLQGAYGMRGQATLANIASRIKPTSTFVGAAAIVLLDKEQGNYAAENEGAILKDITLDGSAINSSNLVSGIKATGYVHGVRLQNINITLFPDRGILTSAYTRTADSISYHPYSWIVNNVQVWATGSDGFRFAGLTDSIINDCRAIYPGRHGFYIDAMANSTFNNCRTEWAAQYGFWLQGSWGSTQGAGGAIFNNITTDRNNFDGVRIEATGTSPLIFNNLMLRRDGRNNLTGAGNYAAIRILGATTPIHLNNLVVYPGTNDDGVGVNSPQIGLHASGSTYVNVVSGFIHAATTAWVDGGSNSNLIRGSKITERVGTTSSFTTTVPTDPTGGGASATVVSRKPNFAVYRGKPIFVQNFAAGHGFVASGFGGATNINQASTSSRAGSQVVSLVTDAAGGTGTLTGTGQTSVDLSGNNHATAWLRTNNQQQLGLLAIRVSDTGGLAAGRYAQWTLCATGVTTTLGSGQQAITNGNTLIGIQMSPADFVVTGSPNLAAVTEWQILLADRNNGQGAQNVVFNSIEVFPSGINKFGTNGILALTFDDGYAGAATLGRQILGEFGYQATFLPIISSLGSNATYMTATQLKALSVDGHEIGVHSYDKTVHDNYSTLTTAECDADTRLAAQWMVDNGYSGETMAYPQGWFYPHDANVQKLYAAGRTTLSTFKHSPTPLLNPSRLRSISQIGGSGGYPVSNLTQSGGVLETSAAKNTLVTLTLHNVTSGASASVLECSAADLKAICQKAKSLNMAVATLGQITSAQR